MGSWVVLGPLNLSGRCGEEKNLPEIEPPSSDYPPHSLVAVSPDVYMFFSDYFHVSYERTLSTEYL
jgi:hypothetical protein